MFLTMKTKKKLAAKSDSGFVLLHRSILEWRWYTDIPTSILFRHLILTANWESKEWMGMRIERGQRICSFRQLSAETGLSIQQLRTAMKHLKSTNEITRENVRPNKAGCSLFTVINYDKYQLPGNPSTDEPTNQ